MWCVFKSILHNLTSFKILEEFIVIIIPDLPKHIDIYVDIDIDIDIDINNHFLFIIEQLYNKPKPLRMCVVIHYRNF